MTKPKPKLSKQAKPQRCWTTFRDNVPMFMGAFSLDDNSTKDANLKARIVMEHLKGLYAHSTFRIGKVTIMEGWIK